MTAGVGPLIVGNEPQYCVDRCQCSYNTEQLYFLDDDDRHGVGRTGQKEGGERKDRASRG